MVDGTYGLGRSEEYVEIKKYRPMGEECGKDCQVGNGVCEIACNTTSCGYDGGDCLKAEIIREKLGMLGNLSATSNHSEPVGLIQNNSIHYIHDLRGRHNISYSGNVPEEHLLHLNASNKVNPSISDDSNRYRDSSELKYSLRSLYKFAPWVRRIYIVTNGQIPSWLNFQHERVRIITHEEIFVNKSHLPVFASPSIESHLHRIPGLSKKFIYFNDDVMLGNYVYPSDFYTKSDGQYFFPSWNVPPCAAGCNEMYLGDKSCDRACNVSACGWDLGDCVNATSGSSNRFNSWDGARTGYQKIACASGCPNNWIGDGVCDATCKNAECGYDGGDCGGSLIAQNIRQLFLSKTENEVLVIPPETVSFFLNFSGIGNEKALLASFSNEYFVRSAVITNKLKILVVLLYDEPDLSATIECNEISCQSNFNISLDNHAAPLRFDFTVARFHSNATGHYNLSVITQIPKSIAQTAPTLSLKEQEDIRILYDELFGADATASRLLMGRQYMDDENNYLLSSQSEENENVKTSKSIVRNATPTPSFQVLNEGPERDTQNHSHIVERVDGGQAKVGQRRMLSIDDNFAHSHPYERVYVFNSEVLKRPIEIAFQLQSVNRPSSSRRDANTLSFAWNPSSNTFVQELETEVDLYQRQKLIKRLFRDGFTSSQPDSIFSSKSLSAVKSDKTMEAIADELIRVEAVPLHSGMNAESVFVSNFTAEDAELARLIGISKAKELSGLLQAEMDEFVTKATVLQMNRERNQVLWPWGISIRLLDTKLQSQTPIGPMRRLLEDHFANSLKHVGILYTKTFGKQLRKVPAHMPHMIDKDIMNELQSKWPALFDATSSHRFRHSEDMQFGFSYFYYMMNAPKEFNLEEFLRDEVDSNGDGIISTSEFQLLLQILAGENRLISYDEANVSALKLRNLTVQHEIAQADPMFPSKYDKEWLDLNSVPIRASTIALNQSLLERLKILVHQKKKYKSETVNSADLVDFYMVGENVTIVEKQLMGIRLRKKKFICLNDDIRTKNPDPRLFMVLRHFYDSYFDAQSPLENPPGVTNEVLHMHEWNILQHERSHRFYFFLGFGFILFGSLCVWISWRSLFCQFCLRCFCSCHKDDNCKRVVV